MRFNIHSWKIQWKVAQMSQHALTILPEGRNEPICSGNPMISQEQNWANMKWQSYQRDEMSQYVVAILWITGTQLSQYAVAILPEGRNEPICSGNPLISPEKNWANMPWQSYQREEISQYVVALLWYHRNKIEPIAVCRGNHTRGTKWANMPWQSYQRDDLSQYAVAILPEGRNAPICRGNPTRGTKWANM